MDFKTLETRTLFALRFWPGKRLYLTWATWAGGSKLLWHVVTTRRR
jgi:hypothetical protein